MIQEPEAREGEARAANIFDIARLVGFLETEYDKWSGPGETWNLEGLAMHLLDEGGLAFIAPARAVVADEQDGLDIADYLRDFAASPVDNGGEG